MAEEEKRKIEALEELGSVSSMFVNIYDDCYNL